MQVLYMYFLHIHIQWKFFFGRQKKVETMIQMTETGIMPACAKVGSVPFKPTGGFKLVGWVDFGGSCEKMRPAFVEGKVFWMKTKTPTNCCEMNYSSWLVCLKERVNMYHSKKQGFTILRWTVPVETHWFWPHWGPARLWILAPQDLVVPWNFRVITGVVTPKNGIIHW